MTSPEILSRQTQDAYSWLNKLIDPIPYEQWDVLPEVIESSVSWQVGHLVMSLYYHTVMVIVGHQTDILQQVPLKEYNELFTVAAPQKVTGRVEAPVLHRHLLLMQDKSLAVIRSLTIEELAGPLIPTPVPHPIANTRFEAIDWNIKHTMWHCGQLGLLKRVVHERFDFGIKIAK